MMFRVKSIPTLVLLVAMMGTSFVVSLLGQGAKQDMKDAGHSAKEAAKDSGMKKSDSEHGHLKITAVKMVSDSCK